MPKFDQSKCRHEFDKFETCQTWPRSSLDYPSDAHNFQKDVFTFIQNTKTFIHLHLLYTYTYYTPTPTIHLHLLYTYTFYTPSLKVKVSLRGNRFLHVIIFLHTAQRDLSNKICFARV